VEPGPRSRPDQEVALELAAIQQRLATMAAEGGAGERDLVAEIRQIRTDLRRLAGENEEIKARLAPLLWDQPDA
jgi:catalase (peroxidase I)